MKNNNLTGFIKKKKSKSNLVVDIMKLINLFLKEGIKSKALKILIDALVFLKLKLNKSPLNFFYYMLKKIKPLVELKNLKMGSNKYLIPTPLTSSRQFLLSVNILLKNAKSRPERNIYALKIANEMWDFYKKKGETYKQLISFFNLVNDNIQNSRFTKFNNITSKK